MGIPNCRGYESSSGGFEKSAAFAMLRPHLNVGAQKWTAIISGFTTHQTLLLTRKYYAKIQPIQLFGFTEETLQPQIPKNKFLNRIKIFRFCPWKWNQKPLHRNQQLWIWILTISKRSHVWSTRKPGKRRVVMKQQRVDLLRENSLVLGPTGWFHKAWNFEAAMNISLVLTNYNNTIVFGFLLFFGFYIIM